METKPIRKVLVTAKIENLVDLENRDQGRLPADEVRLVDDAFVDSQVIEVF